MSEYSDTQGESSDGGSGRQAQGGFRKFGAVVQKAVADKKSSLEEAKRKQASDALAAGALVTRGVFGTSTVEVYENGFVRVASYGDGEAMSQAKGIGKNSPYERLRSITFTPSAQEKDSGSPSAFESALGPALSGLVKGGAGFMKTTAPGLAASGIAHVVSNAARVSQLTISTDHAIHRLTNQVHNGLMKAGKKGHDQVGRELEAAGQSVLPPSAARDHGAAAQLGTDIIDQAPVPIAPTATTPTLSERLRELADLHRDGILSDEEFSSAKAKLLAGL